MVILYLQATFGIPDVKGDHLRITLGQEHLLFYDSR